MKKQKHFFALFYTNKHKGWQLMCPFKSFNTIPSCLECISKAQEETKGMSIDTALCFDNDEYLTKIEIYRPRFIFWKKHVITHKIPPPHFRKIQKIG